MSIDKRWKYLDEFGELSTLRFQKIIEVPEKLDFMVQWQNLNRVGKDAYNKLDVLEHISSNLKAKHTLTVMKRNEMLWSDVLKNYEKNIKFTALNKEELIELTNRLKDTVTSTKWKILRGKNRVFIDSEIYQNSSLIESKNEILISGTKESTENIFRTQAGQIVYPTPVINGKTYTIINEDFNFTDFKTFALKAFDNIGTKRLEDTELKYVFHFLDENWDKGNRFVIRIESTLYNCTSCQRYMQALQEAGKDAGKTIEIEFVAHPEIKRAKQLKNLK